MTTTGISCAARNGEKYVAIDGLLDGLLDSDFCLPESWDIPSSPTRSPGRSSSTAAKIATQHLHVHEDAFKPVAELYHADLLAGIDMWDDADMLEAIRKTPPAVVNRSESASVDVTRLTSV